MSDGIAVNLYNQVKLTRDWLRKNGETIITCGECGRWLTEEQWENHKRGSFGPCSAFEGKVR